MQISYTRPKKIVVFRKTFISFFVALLLTILALFIGDNFLNSPLLQIGGFPWIWFLPFLLALTYGAYPALLSLILIFLTIFFTSHPFSFPIQMRPNLLAGFLLTIIAATFHRFFIKRLIYADNVNSYLENRVEDIGNAYNATLLSHQRLEQNFVTKPVTLRSGIEALRELMSTRHNEFDSDLANKLIHLIGYYCSFNVAAIYLFEKNTLNTKPIAYIGIEEDLAKQDPLIEKVLERKTISYVAVNTLNENLENKYLVVAPLLVKEKMIGVLTVKEMPFLYLNEENLNTLNILLTYFFDATLLPKADSIIKTFNDCPSDFANELIRLKDLQSKTGVDSALFAIYFENSDRVNDYKFRIIQERRKLDSIWETTFNNKVILLTLMPLTQRAGAEGYRARIKSILHDSFNVNLEKDKEIRLDSWQLADHRDMIKLLNQVVHTA